jgi:hydrogenase nickel incorporation protein HypB
METRTIEVKRDIRAEQLAAANEFRHNMARQGTLVVRLISSPGSGKTTLLEKTAQRLGTSHAIGVLVGDVETDRDAQRLAPFAPTVQITTGGACHLEIPLVERAFLKFTTSSFDILFIEDVGNLVCPASHDLGEHLRVLLLSTTEGDDKPGKYPKAFRTSDVLIITKADLLPYVPFSVKQAEQDAHRVQPALMFFTLSAQTGEGVTEWCRFLEHQRKRLLTAEAAKAVGSHFRSYTAAAEAISTSENETRPPLSPENQRTRRAKRPASKIMKVGEG